MMMAESLIPPEVVVVDELGPLLVVVCQQEGVDVAQPDYWHADNKESLTKTSISESILIIFELCGFFLDLKTFFQKWKEE